MKKLITCLSLALLLCAVSVKADTLQTADPFAVLAGSTVTNAGAGVLGATVITGELGVSPGSTCTGFVTCPVTGPGTISGTVHLGDAVAGTAKNDLTTAYNNLAAEGLLPTAHLLSGGVLTGQDLVPGVYTTDVSSMLLAGTLKLDDGGVDGSAFVFVMSSSLTTDPDSIIDVSKLQPGDSLFWVVGSSATIGNDTAFYGNILASASITFDPGATDLCGRALAETAAVSFKGQGTASPFTENQVSIVCTSNLTGSNGLGGGTTSSPEPGTLSLLALGLSGIGFLRKKRQR